MATFGSTATTTATTNDIATESFNSCIVVGGSFTLSEDGRVSSIQAYTGGTNSETGVSVKYAIYNSSRNLLCQTESSSYDISGNQWVIRSLTEPYNLTAGTYWLCGIGNGLEMEDSGSTLYIYANNTGGSGRYQTMGSGDFSFPDTFNGSTDALLYDIYATYTALVVWPQTDDATSIGGTSATLNGNLLKLSGGNATIRGFVYDTVSRVYPGEVSTALSGYASVVSESGSFSTGAYSLNISEQTPGRKYYRAFAYDGTTYNYGYEKTVDIKSVAWLTA